MPMPLKLTDSAEQSAFYISPDSPTLASDRVSVLKGDRGNFFYKCYYGGCILKGTKKLSGYPRKFCIKHCRFHRMIDESKKRKKKVPTLWELNSMFRRLKNFECEACCITMRWTRKESQTKVITLQHDRNGELRFVCMSCNSKHRFYEGDTYYQFAKVL